MNSSLMLLQIPETQEPKIYYSPSKKGFLRSDMHKDSMPEDAIEITYQRHQELLQATSQGKVIQVVDGQVVAVDPVTDPSIMYKAFESVTQKHLDDFAKLKGYDNIVTACTYATSTNPVRASEGQLCVNARDQAWDFCFAEIEDFQNGIRPIPTIAQYTASLPPLTWP